MGDLGKIGRAGRQGVNSEGETKSPRLAVDNFLQWEKMNVSMPRSATVKDHGKKRECNATRQDGGDRLH